MQNPCAREGTELAGTGHGPCVTSGYGNTVALALRCALSSTVTAGDLPSDDLDMVVRNSLTLNRYFQSVILKPFGYSPDIDPMVDPPVSGPCLHPRQPTPTS